MKIERYFVAKNKYDYYVITKEGVFPVHCQSMAHPIKEIENTARERLHAGDRPIYALEVYHYIFKYYWDNIRPYIDTDVDEDEADLMDRMFYKNMDLKLVGDMKYEDII